MAIFNHVTLREIGAELGVSHVTVSLALKDSPRISKGRRLEVRKMASKMGYRPDPVLTSLCAYRNRKRSVKIKIHSALAWVNHWDQPDALRRIGEFDAYWVGASAEAERFGYHLEEFVWTRALTAERFQTILHTRNLRGVLIPPHPSEPDWGNFNWENFSVIRFGLSVRNPESHVITADHLRGIIAAIQKIHDYGYKRIGFVVPGDLDLRLGCVCKIKRH
jgi:LacI family transcriptional regulator